MASETWLRVVSSVQIFWRPQKTKDIESEKRNTLGYIIYIITVCLYIERHVTRIGQCGPSSWFMLSLLLHCFVLMHGKEWLRSQGSDKLLSAWGDLITSSGNVSAQQLVLYSKLIVDSFVFSNFATSLRNHLCESYVSCSCACSPEDPFAHSCDPFACANSFCRISRKASVMASATETKWSSKSETAQALCTFRPTWDKLSWLLRSEGLPWRSGGWLPIFKLLLW